MDKPVVEVETEINADPQAVWAEMTKKQSPMFMGATMDTDWRPGSHYTLKGEWGGKGFTDYGEIETAEPRKELSFTHWSKTPDRPAFRLTTSWCTGTASVKRLFRASHWH